MKIRPSRASFPRVLFLSLAAAALLTGCGMMANCGSGDNGCHANQRGADNAPAVGGGTGGGGGGGTGGGATVYTFETLPNASSDDGHGAAVAMTLYAADAIAIPIAQDGPGAGPPYYAAVSVALNPGQTVYLRLADPGAWGGYYSVRAGDSGRQGGVSAGVAGHPDLYDTANGMRPSGGADDAYSWATPLLLGETQDHGFWPPGEEDWLVFTAP
jgi:hypothetical protein